jgi:virginiamycin B lyase
VRGLPLIALAPLVSLFAAGDQAALSTTPRTFTVEADRTGGPAISITEWTLPAAHSMPKDAFVSRRDGVVWYSAASSNLLGRIDPKTGAVEEFRLRPGSDPYAVVEHFGSGIQGRVYFSSRTGGFIGELDPNKREVRELRIRGGNGTLHDLTFDPNGDLWFTMLRAKPPEQPQGSKIGRINLFSSEIKLVDTPTANASPYALAVNSSGTPFFTEMDSPRLASVHPMTFRVTEHSLPNARSGVRGLVITQDDVVWYTDHARGYLGQFDPQSRQFKEWPSPGGASSHPSALATAGGMLWFIEAAPKPKLVRFDPRTQQFQAWSLEASGEIEHLYAHTDGSLWLTMPSGNRVARITIATQADPK